MFVHRGYLGRIDTDPASGRLRGRIARHGGDLPFAADLPAATGAAFRAAVDTYLAGLPAICHTPAAELMARYYDQIPEGFFELAGGRVLVGGSERGTRALLTWLLELLGPGAAIDQAPLDRWWQALRLAHDPPPVGDDWRAWAAAVPAPPAPEPAGPHHAWEVVNVRQRLHQDLIQATHDGPRRHQVGRFLWRFNVKLDGDGFMPDMLLLGPGSVGRLRGYYVDGPPDLIVEVVMLGHEARDLEVKRRRYEAAGVPEYWAIDPFRREVALWRMVGGRYVDQAPDARGEYRTPVLPGLVLAPARLWWWTRVEDGGEDEDERFDRTPAIWREPGDWPAPWDHDGDEELLEEPWPLPLALDPTPISYERFIRWQPEAKFEWIGGWPWIGGSRDTVELLGLLLLSVGLVEAVRLLPAARWVAALAAAERLGPLAGRLSAGELAAALRPWLGDEAVAKLASPRADDWDDAWHRTEAERQAAREARAEWRLQDVQAALRWLLCVEAPAAASAWFTTPCADLEGARPLDRLMLTGPAPGVVLAARQHAWRLTP